MSGETVLEVRDLKTHFFLRRGVVQAVDGVSFSLRRGEVLGLVGESGCGKSLTALSIMRLLPSGGARTVAGEVLLNGDNLLARITTFLKTDASDQFEVRHLRHELILCALGDPRKTAAYVQPFPARRPHGP